MSGSASGVGGGGGTTTVQQQQQTTTTSTHTSQENSFLQRAQESGETPEEAEQNLRAAEKKWGDAFNTMFNQISVHQQLDSGLADEHPASGSTHSSGGATGT